jgi:hypothetical protein
MRAGVIEPPHQLLHHQVCCMVGAMWTSAVCLPLLILTLAPPDAEGEDYQQAIGDLESLVEIFSTSDRAQTIKSLERLLAIVGRHPDEAREDHTVSETLLQGWVILAGLYLAGGDTVAASDVMDEAIRTARGQTLPVREYGPKVNQLYKDRKAALQELGMARITVECEVACKVVINERLLPERSEDLFLGTYRVRVKAAEGDAPWEFHSVDLTSAGTVATLTYKDPTPPEPEPAPEPQPEPKPKAKRMLPRGAEIAGIAAGVGLVIAGAVLLSFDGKCSVTKQPPTSDITPEACGNIYETTPPGGALIGVGAGLLVVSGVMLSIDEVRVGRERGRQVMVGVSLRF